MGWIHLIISSCCIRVSDVYFDRMKTTAKIFGIIKRNKKRKRVGERRHPFYCEKNMEFTIMKKCKKHILFTK